MSHNIEAAGPTGFQVSVVCGQTASGWPVADFASLKAAEAFVDVVRQLERAFGEGGDLMIERVETCGLVVVKFVAVAEPVGFAQMLASALACIGGIGCALPRISP